MVLSRVSDSCPCVCSLGIALARGLDPDLHFKATSVGLWAFSQCVAAVGSAEPRSALGPSDLRAGFVPLPELGHLSRPGSDPECGFTLLRSLGLEGFV